jgi:hypothetical protein
MARWGKNAGRCCRPLDDGRFLGGPALRCFSVRRSAIVALPRPHPGASRDSFDGTRISLNERAIQVVGVFNDDVARSNRSFDGRGLVAGITSNFGRLRQWCAVRLFHVLSRDSAIRPGGRFPLRHRPGLVRSRNDYVTGQVGLASRPRNDPRFSRGGLSSHQLPTAASRG